MATQQDRVNEIRRSTDRPGRLLTPQPSPRVAEAPPTALGDVLRDAADHAQVIARDSLQIARLEAKRFGERVKQDVAPRAAIGMIAAVCAVAAVVFALIAIFIGLGAVIEPVEWRLAIYAVFFLFVAGACALMAQRRTSQARTRPPTPS